MLRLPSWMFVLLTALPLALGCQRTVTQVVNPEPGENPTTTNSGTETLPRQESKPLTVGTPLKPAETDYEPQKQRSLRLTPRARFDERGKVREVVAFSPDGRYLAVAGSEPDVVLWDLQTGAEAYRFPVKASTRSIGSIKSLQFAPDGKTLLTDDGDSALLVWDLVAGKLRHRMTGPRSIQAATMSANGARAAVVTFSGDVALFDLASGESLRRADKVAEAFLGKALALSPDGNWVAVAGKDKTVLLLDGTSLEVKHTLTGHGHAIHAVAFSPDGKTLASVAFDDGLIKLWDVAGGKEKLSIKAGSGLLICVEFSPGGTTLLTGGANLRVWDIEKGTERASARGFFGNLSSVAFSPDGTAIAAVSNADKGVFVWDAEVGRERARWVVPERSSLIRGTHGKLLMTLTRDKLEFRDPATGEVRDSVAVRDPNNEFAAVGAAVSEDGKWLLFNRGEKAILWDLVGKKEKATLATEGGRCTDIALSKDGKSAALVTGSEVELWDLAGPKRKHILKGHRYEVKTLAFSPDGTRLATGSVDYTVRLWKVVDGSQERRIVAQEEGVAHVDWSPDGKLILSAGTGSDDVVRIWEADTGKLRHALRDHVLGVPGAAFTADGKGVVTNDRENTLRLWSVETGKTQTVVAAPANYPGGLVSLEGGKSVAVLMQKEVRVWEVSAFTATEGGKKVYRNLDQDADEPFVFFPVHATLTGHDDFVRSLGYSEDGKRLIAQCGDKAVCVWDTTSLKRLHTFTHGAGEVLRMAVSKDGSMFALACRDQTVRVWDVTTGKEKYRLEGHDGFVRSVAFSPDGKLLASGTGGFGQGEVIVWDLGTGKQQRKPVRDNNVYDVLAFSPDGKVLATGTFNGEVRFWNTATWAAGETIKADDSVACLAFSRDGSLLATGGGWTSTSNFDVCVWDMATRKPKHKFSGHRYNVTSLAFTPDARLLFSASLNIVDGVTRIWDLQSGKAVGTVVGQPPLAVSPDGRFLANETKDRAIYLRDTAPLRDEALRKALDPLFDAGASIGLEGEELRIELKVKGPDSTAALASVAKLPRPVHLNLSGSTNLDDEALALLASATNLRSLNLEFCDGITPNGAKHLAGLKGLQKLDLAFVRGLSGAGIEHLRGLEKLTELRLASAELNDADIKVLEGMKALRTLNVQSNEIGDGAVASLVKLSALTELDLGDTRITGKGLEQLKGLPALKKLSLGRARLEAGWEKLATLKGLEELNLAASDVSDDGLKFAASMPNLTKLDLTGTTLTGEGLKHLAGLKKLTELKLDHIEGFKGTNLQHLKGTTSLIALNLGATEVDDAGLVGLKDWVHLQKLKLPRKTTDKGLAAIGGLKGLIALDLDDLEGLTDAGLEALKDLPKLASLTMVRTKIGDAGLAHLKGIKTLRSLNVGILSSATEKGLEDLKKAIPELQVVR